MKPSKCCGLRIRGRTHPVVVWSRDQPSSSSECFYSFIPYLCGHINTLSYKTRKMGVTKVSSTEAMKDIYTRCLNQWCECSEGGLTPTLAVSTFGFNSLHLLGYSEHTADYVTIDWESTSEHASRISSELLWKFFSQNTRTKAMPGCRAYSKAPACREVPVHDRDNWGRGNQE